MIRIFALLAIFVFYLKSSAQEIVNLDVNKIEHKKVFKFLQENDLFDSEDFINLEPLCSNKQDLQYNSHSKTFAYEAQLVEVWDAYTTSQIDEIWNSKKVILGTGYSSSKNEFCYRDYEDSPHMEPGLVIVTRLKLVMGLLRIVVSHKITQLDEDGKTIEFCYMKGGKTEGSQILTFTEGPENTTFVTHLTKYKSKSSFRDKRLYPFFHNKAIDQLHKTMQNIVDQTPTYPDSKESE